MSERKVYVLFGQRTEGDNHAWIEAVYDDFDEAQDVARDLNQDAKDVCETIKYSTSVHDVIPRKLTAKNGADAIIKLIDTMDINSLNDSVKRLAFIEALQSVTK